ncbi:adenosylcobinamide hydrolase [Halorubrum aquaticum]|uniref:Adenosylcobinamide hydrolase n=1 Tax=Halorubrum aquaticum TaxID=387340 RepID=A0A1I3B555_9EURY|nr:adenosylcobinamide amidohydrolase [Halorubrum aquaticum]SFH57226.1 adenosylcobinamide hydrolase [Halorubrum aquaticum]
MNDGSPAFRAHVVDGVCRFRSADGPTRFLSTGFDGGVRVADAAYNLTVPEGWDDAGRRDLRAYVDGRIGAVGFGEETETDGHAGNAPALLTGVDQRHARVARLDGATALATAGVSNPAALPVPGGEAAADAGSLGTDATTPTGTVNLLVGSDRALAPGALANLVAVVAEAKAATLLATVGFPGTTSDAVVVGCPARSDPEDEPAPFSGSATPVGSAVRACVREAVRASLVSRYGADLEDAPETVAAAEHGVVTDRSATVSTPVEPDPSTAG